MAEPLHKPITTIVLLGAVLLSPCNSMAQDGSGTICQPPEPVIERSSGDKLFNDSIYVVRELMRGRNHRPLDGKVAWAKLNLSDGKFGVSVADAQDTYCTNVTHAAFLKFISDACNEDAARGKCDKNTISGLNGNNFQFTWNADGIAQAALVDLLGLGESIQVSEKDMSEETLRKVAKRGDIVQFNKKPHGSHVVIFDRICRDQICYISSDGPTNGNAYKQAGWACEPLANLKLATFTRIDRIENLGNSRKFSSSFASDPRFQKVIVKGPDGSDANFEAEDVPGLLTKVPNRWLSKLKNSAWGPNEQSQDAESSFEKEPEPRGSNPAQ